MRRRLSQSIPRKLMAVMLATTFLALLVSGLAMLLYDLHAYRQTWVDDLTTQADLLGRSSAPALQFNDPRTAQGNLALLKVRPNVKAAAIYGVHGRPFARYLSKDSEASSLPLRALSFGYRISGNSMSISHPVVENGETIGSVYLVADYPWRNRMENYLMIMAAVMVASLAIAAFVAFRLQATVSRPILDISKVARDVMLRRDYSLRASKSTDDEVGVLATAFNDMLDEVERRAAATEAANRELKQETKERREAELALRLADRHKDEFLATLAHELRNPLAPLSNGLTLLQVAGDNPALAANAREIMERQLAQMVRLVDDLIDVSRISRGKLVIRKERLVLQETLRNAVEIAEPMIASRRHALQLEIPDAPLWVDGDSTRLAQVFSNLLNNSAKYTEPGGQIALKLAADGACAAVSVSDNGIGIPAEMLEQVFDMFAQVDKSLERSQAGLGVGLTLARRLVELHGGTIAAQSAGRGHGSSFTVKLPLVVAPNAATARDTGDSKAAAGAGYRVLLADDNVDFATTLATLLRRLGNEVLVVHDGERALQEASQFCPQFAFLDIGLPQRNGYDLARALRLLPATADCTMVAVTGWGQEQDRRLALEAGFDRHLVKPVKVAQIEEVLRAGTRLGESEKNLR